MEIILYNSFGIFTVPKALNDYMDAIKEPFFRDSPQAIEWIKVNPRKALPLKIVNVPENNTDWVIKEYDGNEYIICVVDGKLNFIYPD